MAFRSAPPAPPRFAVGLVASALGAAHRHRRRPRPLAPAALASFALAACALTACASRPRMCVAPTDCGASACVAGRCQAEEGIPVIQSARRVVLDPVAVAYVRRHGDVDPETPIATLGRASDGDAVLFLRFDAALPPGATIVEAYLLLERSPALDVDPAPIALHAARVVDPWDPRSIRWGRQPRVEEVRAASTLVTGGRALVRLDVGDLARRWRAHDPRDRGVAVVADNVSATGIAFALAPAPRDDEEPRGLGVSARAAAPVFTAESADRADAPVAPLSPPRLEIYLR